MMPTKMCICCDVNDSRSGEIRASLRADVNLFMYSPCLLPVRGKSGVGLAHIMLLIIVRFVKIGAKKDRE